MTAVNQDMTLYTGDDKMIEVTIRDTGGNAIDITNITAAQYVLKRFRNSETTLLTKTLGSGITVTSGTAGKLQIDIDASDTSSATPHKYYHELRITNSSSQTSTVMTGKVELLPADAL